MPFVVDNSVVMSWFFADEMSRYADRVLDSLAAEEALVPEIWPLEVANVLLVAERRRRVDAVRSDVFLDLLDALPITVETLGADAYHRDLLTLGRATGLSAYDASYLHLAHRKGIPLATRDRAMRRAANAAGIPIYLA